MDCLHPYVMEGCGGHDDGDDDDNNNNNSNKYIYTMFQSIFLCNQSINYKNHENANVTYAFVLLSIQYLFMIRDTILYT